MFAANVDNVVGLIFVLVAIIGWVINLVSGKQKGGIGPAAQRPRPPARPRDDKLQKEIDIFLEETRGGPAKKPAPQRQPERKPQQPAKAPQKKPTAPAAQQPARRRGPGGDVASRAAPVSKDLGTGVRTHLAEHMSAGKVTQEVAQDLKDRVGESVSQHLGQFSASAAPSPSSQPSIAQEIGQLLRNPVSVRQAMLINTILSPPLGRRK